MYYTIESGSNVKIIFLWQKLSQCLLCIPAYFYLGYLDSCIGIALFVSFIINLFVVAVFAKVNFSIAILLLTARQSLKKKFYSLIL